MDRVGDIPGYGTVWYKPTGITNILSMSRATNKFRVIFDSEGAIFFRMVVWDREVRFQIRPNWIYYFDTAERENSFLIFNTVSEHQERVTQR